MKKRIVIAACFAAVSLAATTTPAASLFDRKHAVDCAFKAGSMNYSATDWWAETGEVENFSGGQLYAYCPIDVEPGPGDPNDLAYAYVYVSDMSAVSGAWAHMCFMHPTTGSQVCGNGASSGNTFIGNKSLKVMAPKVSSSFYLPYVRLAVPSRYSTAPSSTFRGLSVYTK
jgi:hypothetical protein